MSPIDLTVIAIYMVATLAVGLAMKGKAASADDLSLIHILQGVDRIPKSAGLRQPLNRREQRLLLFIRKALPIHVGVEGVYLPTSPTQKRRVDAEQ